MSSSPAPSDSNIVYVDSQNGYIARVNLKTGVSKFIRPTLEDVSQKPPSALTYRFDWTSPIAVSPTSADEVFPGGNVLFKSVDGGAHWSVISPDVTHNDKSRQRTSGGPIEYDSGGAETYNTILSITLAPTDTNVIWLGTDDGNVEVTRDGGKSWRNARPAAKGLPPEGRVYQVGVSPFDAGTAYITLDYHMFGDDRPFVFKTTNYGASWTSIAAGLPATARAHVVREDPRDRNFLVLGTDAGLWYSRDGGAHWESLAKEFPAAPVFDVSFVRNTRALAVRRRDRGRHARHGAGGGPRRPAHSVRHDGGARATVGAGLCAVLLVRRGAERHHAAGNGGVARGAAGLPGAIRGIAAHGRSGVQYAGGPARNGRRDRAVGSGGGYGNGARAPFPAPRAASFVA